MNSLIEYWHFNDLTQLQTVLSLGLLVTGLGFAAQFFGDVVVQVSFSIFGFVGGPLFGVVTLGIFVPFINDIASFNFTFRRSGISFADTCYTTITIYDN